MYTTHAKYIPETLHRLGGIPKKYPASAQIASHAKAVAKG